MEIAILTSSRADYGFYKPLLAYPDKGPIHFDLIVFGTHLSRKHGYTVKVIEQDGFDIAHRIPTVLTGDSPGIIAKTIGRIHQQFAQLWASTRYDYILCLGDRYEMYAAVSAAVPFNLPVIHLSGGEETLGAIDNYYRHALTLMANIHCTNTPANACRVAQLLGHDRHVHATGSLAIDNVLATPLYSVDEFKQRFKFDLTANFILFTFHPETVNYAVNQTYLLQITQFLAETPFNVLATMPNADTHGDGIRAMLSALTQQHPRIKVVESLGSRGYYTALQHCYSVVGNSSSGIVEAASFGKYALNLGDRQKGRERGSNVLDCKIVAPEMHAQLNAIDALPALSRINIYGDGRAAERIMALLKQAAQGLNI